LKKVPSNAEVRCNAISGILLKVESVDAVARTASEENSFITIEVAEQIFPYFTALARAIWASVFIGSLGEVARGVICPSHRESDARRFDLRSCHVTYC
jgi:hypothetical protein